MADGGSVALRALFPNHILFKININLNSCTKTQSVNEANGSITVTKCLRPEYFSVVLTMRWFGREERLELEVVWPRDLGPRK